MERIVILPTVIAILKRVPVLLSTGNCVQGQRTAHIEQ